MTHEMTFAEFGWRDIRADAFSHVLEKLPGRDYEERVLLVAPEDLPILR